MRLAGVGAKYPLEEKWNSRYQGFVCDDETCLGSGQYIPYTKYTRLLTEQIYAYKNKHYFL